MNHVQVERLWDVPSEVLKHILLFIPRYWNKLRKKKKPYLIVLIIRVFVVKNIYSYDVATSLAQHGRALPFSRYTACTYIIICRWYFTIAFLPWRFLRWSLNSGFKMSTETGNGDLEGIGVGGEGYDFVYAFHLYSKRLAFTRCKKNCRVCDARCRKHKL